ncbi:MAG: tyrosine-type recombinase/integrase [Acidimicrobiia bacterium]
MRPDLSPFRPDYVSRAFQAAARRLGLKPIGPHGLRHSLATSLGEAEVPLLIVSRLLGHSSTRVTSDVYFARVRRDCWGSGCAGRGPSHRFLVPAYFRHTFSPRFDFWR